MLIVICVKSCAICYIVHTLRSISVADVSYDARGDSSFVRYIADQDRALGHGEARSKSYMLLISIIIAFTMTLVFMVMFRKFARRIELIDEPGGRKFHDGAVPLVGGAAMYGGLLFGLLLLPGDVMATAYLLLAAGLLVAVGVVDDKHALPWPLRIGVQTLAVLIMVYGGGLILYDIGDPFGFGTIHLGVAALFITLLVCLTVINAFNLVDGTDGLAGSLALITITAVLIVGGIQASAMQIEMVACAALLGFLLFNFPMAANRRVLSFMGDSGSTLLGFLILWTTISISQGADRVVSPVICLWFASIPIYDLLTCFANQERPITGFCGQGSFPSHTKTRWNESAARPWRLGWSANFVCRSRSCCTYHRRSRCRHVLDVVCARHHSASGH